MQSSKHKEDFGHMLGKPKSFACIKFHLATKHEARNKRYGSSWRENVVEACLLFDHHRKF